jgi:deoxyribonuclease-4
MILGAHESVAGGLPLAFERCARDGAEALQLWTRSSRQWAAAPLDDALVREFRRRLLAERRRGPFPTAAHASYLINLAATNRAIWERSTRTLLEECQRAERLGVRQVIVHPGASLDGSIAAGIARVARALRRICASLRGARVRILLEITAGQGSCVGCSFEQLAEMLQQAGERRVGVCLDTQHMFAAGIDWTTPRGYERTFEEFDRTIGLRHLRAFHLNDSKRPLGARVDRHAVIGDGYIGLAPFGRLVGDPRFAELPGFLETPPLPNGEESYALGLSRLRSLI